MLSLLCRLLVEIKRSEVFAVHKDKPLRKDTDEIKDL